MATDAVLSTTVNTSVRADDPRESSSAAQLVDADHQRRENHRHDDHEDEPQEDLADRPEKGRIDGRDPRALRVRRQGRAQHDPEDECDQEADVEFHGMRDISIADLRFAIVD